MTLKYFRTVIEIEILSEDTPISTDMTLTQIEYDITSGDCSGVVKLKSQKEVTPQKMAKLLIAQGSDPSFMMLDKDGNPTED